MCTYEKCSRNPISKIGRIIAMFIGGVTIAGLFGLAFGWLVMLLWNWLMPHMFGLPLITYWQGFGILVLSKLLLSGFRGPHEWAHQARMHKDHHYKWKHKFDRDIDDEWLPAGDYRNWMFYRTYWKEKGKKDFEEYLKDHGHAKDNSTTN